MWVVVGVKDGVDVVVVCLVGFQGGREWEWENRETSPVYGVGRQKEEGGVEER